MSMQSYFRDLSTLGQIDGINSGIYSVLTASFVLAGFGYIFAPAQVYECWACTLFRGCHAHAARQLLAIWLAPTSCR